MIIRIAILITLLGGIISLPLKGLTQNIKSDLLEMRKTYQNLKGMSAEIQLHLYKSYEDAKPIDSQIGKFKQQGNQCFSSFGTTESLTNKNYSMLIDHDEKMILIQPVLPVSFTPDTQIDMDSLLELCSKVSVEEIGESKRSITFQFDNYRYRTVKVFFNPSSYILSKVVLFLAEPEDLVGGSDPVLGRVEIVYANVKINPTLTAKDFSSASYVHQQNGKIVLANSYSSYRLANYLPKP